MMGVRSAGLSVGAGLGSSAAFSMALAATLLQLQERLGSMPVLNSGKWCKGLAHTTSR